tara:strand:- start:821 stop:2020 length:1200 start_codon:yes stop_codon:yes gene_type:complete
MSNQTEDWDAVEAMLVAEEEARVAESSEVAVAELDEEVVRNEGVGTDITEVLAQIKEETVRPDDYEERLAKWTVLCNDIFGDNWDINSSNPISANQLIIHYPKLTITNSEESEHEILDLYVQLPLNDLLIPTEGLRGYRGTYTLSEYETRYRHSHLSTGINPYASSFCLGSNDFSRQFWSLVGDEQDTFWEDLQMVLVGIHLYVGWESIEGGPYTQIKNIARRNRGSLRARYMDANSLNIVYDTWIETYGNGISDMVSLSRESGKQLFTSDTDKIGASLVDIVRDMDESYINIVFENGLEIPLTSVNDIETEEQIESLLKEHTEGFIERHTEGVENDDNVGLVYKEETIIPKVIKDPLSVTDEMPRKERVVKSISDYISKQFQLKINKFIIKKQHECKE